MLDQIRKSIQEHRDLLAALETNLLDDIGNCARIMTETLENGGTVFWCGNGGSASDAEHLSAELVGRFNDDRKALSSFALTANTSTISSIGNDYGFDHIFSRQVEGVVKAGDLLIGISTSGNSANVENAIRKAVELKCRTVGLLGRDGGSLAGVCDLVLNVGGENTARIQEMHILVGHVLCELVERSLSRKNV